MWHTWRWHTWRRGSRGMPLSKAGGVTEMNELCHTYECVTSHVWISHVKWMEESCQTYQSVMSHTWTWCSCHTHEQECLEGSLIQKRVTSHIWRRVTWHTSWIAHDTHMQRLTSHISHINGTWHTDARVKWSTLYLRICANSYTRHVTHMDES